MSWVAWPIFSGQLEATATEMPRRYGQHGRVMPAIYKDLTDRIINAINEFEIWRGFIVYIVSAYSHCGKGITILERRHACGLRVSSFDSVFFHNSWVFRVALQNIVHDVLLRFEIDHL